MLYVSQNGVMFKEKRSSAIMLSCDSIEIGELCLAMLNHESLVCLHQEFMVDAFKEKFKFEGSLICFQAVYLKKEKIQLNLDVIVKPLDDRYLEFIHQHYDVIDDPSYIKIRLEHKEMFGAFRNDQILGFIGKHAEGSMGMLEVLPEYRNQGIASQLECALINQLLDQGLTPFCQIEIENEKSLGLQRKLGLTISKEKVYWLF